ncbi:GntR family transcriptional regulator [Aurantimonas sp. VKM B-3413]|uniref:GntR family transcriptional regulator n=1 Tax=Aurantimonas sp. VKM B-3413 TaxID=2779401 RepID=UPI001E351DFE|nr:GntR family transcriptional regulator [Aurantimonas sp. VKM B-3413]MCB8840475.1 GntR family transcriptional regulator [Aurantimonas sp. VKM B-3413]
MAIKPLERPQSLFELALDGIRGAIIDGTIQLGEHLSELRISEWLGVSKTPVREALQELRREGLVRIGPKSGTVVFLPDETELREIFDYRAMLELGAARRMFERNRAEATADMAKIVRQMHEALGRQDHAGYRKLDSRFHNTIIAASGNSLIVEAYAPLTAKVDALRNRGLEDLDVVRRSLAFHEKLLALLQAEEADGFCSGLAQHIANSRRDYTNWLSRSLPDNSR